MKPAINAYKEYQANQVDTADQQQLIVMLYDGVIKFLQQGVEHVQDFRQYDQANERILRAQDILTELMVSLNMDAGGEVANNLLNLYAYMKKELLEANLEKDAERIKPIINMLKELKSAWEQIDTKSQASMPSPQEKQSHGGFAAEG